MKAPLLFSAVVLCSASTAMAEPARAFPSYEERIRERTETIIIPLVEFRKTRLADALEFLRSESRKQDPQHEGMAIFDPKPWPIESRYKPEPPGGWPVYNPLEEHITLTLRNVSLMQALRYVAAEANCRPRPARTGMAIIRLAVSYDPMPTLTIPLAKANPADVARIRANPRKFFEDQGVLFYAEAACSFEADGTTLVATVDAGDISLVHHILEISVHLADPPPP